MSELASLFNSLNLSKEQLEDLVKTISTNPMAAMAKVQELDLPPDFLQKAMTVVMTNPNEVAEFAKSLGLQDNIVDEARAKLENMLPK